MIEIAEMIRRLDGLAMEQAQAEALATAGDRLATAVREALSVRPGGAHEAPWIETGRLRGGIGASVDGDGLIVGSVDPVALDQERGTRMVPARPFLAPAAAALGEVLAEEIGARVATALTPDR